jgi:hypothetical protein
VTALLPVLFESLPYHNWEEVDLEPVTDAEIAHDLRALSPAECAARGIRHSSTDDHSTGIRTDDTFELRLGMLRGATRRAFR